MRIVVDSCVLLDLCVQTAPRHPEAAELRDRIRAKQIDVLAPFHAIFELAAAIKSIKMRGPIKFDSLMSWKAPFKLELIPIDQRFFDRYFSLEIPYLKAGDLLFLLLAKREGIPLVSEDQEMLKKAALAGVEACTIKQMSQKLN